jgi:hypothetical protein
MPLQKKLIAALAATLAACNPPVTPGDVPDAGCGGVGQPCCAENYCDSDLICGSCAGAHVCAPASQGCDAGPVDAGLVDAGVDAGSDAGDAGDAGVCTTTPPTAAIQVLHGTTTVDPDTFTFAPFTGAVLLGSSSGTGGLPVAYDWEIMSQPIGGNASFVGSSGTVSYAASGQQVTFATSAPGPYVIGVTATVGACTSAPARVTVHVGVSGDLLVMLTWAEPYGDLDLHDIGPGGTFFESMPYEGDLDWTYAQGNLWGPGLPSVTGATSPDWGHGNTVAPDNLSGDDATMLVDQRFGNGPEIVSHPAPFPGSYKLLVHYYCAENELTQGPNMGAATPTIQVFAQGALLWSATGPSMVEDQVWEAAAVNVADGGALSVTALTTPIYFGNQGCMEGENAPPDAGP